MGSSDDFFRKSLQATQFRLEYYVILSERSECGPEGPRRSSLRDLQNDGVGFGEEKNIYFREAVASGERPGSVPQCCKFFSLKSKLHGLTVV